MDDGFYVLACRSGYDPYVIVGWFRRRDLFVMAVNSRVIRRFGTNVQLSTLAADGPQQGTQLLDLVPSGRGVFVGAIRSFDVANPAAWAAWCPKPAGWDDGDDETRG